MSLRFQVGSLLALSLLSFSSPVFAQATGPRDLRVKLTAAPVNPSGPNSESSCSSGSGPSATTCWSAAARTTFTLPSLPLPPPCMTGDCDPIMPVLELENFLALDVAHGLMTVDSRGALSFTTWVDDASAPASMLFLRLKPDGSASLLPITPTQLVSRSGYTATVDASAASLFNSFDGVSDLLVVVGPQSVPVNLAPYLRSTSSLLAYLEGLKTAGVYSMTLEQ